MLDATPKARPGGRSERVADAVKQATINLLVADGPTALTLEAVAAKAGVNRTTLYRRWGDKTRLVTWALLETVAEEVPYVDKGSLAADLMVVLSGVNKFLGTTVAKAVMQIMIQDTQTSTDVNGAISEFWDSRFNRMKEVIDRAITRGEHPANLDQDYLVDQLFGPVYLRHITGRGAVSRSYLKTLISDVLARIPSK